MKKIMISSYFFRIMKFHFIDNRGFLLTEIITEKHELKTAQDALDIVGNSIYKNSYKIILHQDGLVPEFFDLKSGLAGEMLQKFVNYNCELAIIGDFTKYSGQALKDFIRECNAKGQINFVTSMEDAQKVLLKNDWNP